jgi:hypothetical protein
MKVDGACRFLMHYVQELAPLSLHVMLHCRENPMYRGRYGQPITDPASIEARRILTQLRRLDTINLKAGREWPYTTVGELAKSAKLTTDQVVAWVKDHDAWLLGLVNLDDDVAKWGVYQDGE